jgi:hypothetical protein
MASSRPRPDVRSEGSWNLVGIWVLPGWNLVGWNLGGWNHAKLRM